MTIREYLENVLRLGIDLDTQMCLDDPGRTPFMQFFFASPERNAGEKFLALQTKHDLDLSMYLEERFDAMYGHNVDEITVFKELYLAGITAEDIKRNIDDEKLCILAEQYFSMFKKENEENQLSEHKTNSQLNVIKEVICIAEKAQEWIGEKTVEKDTTKKLMDAVAEYGLESGWCDNEIIDTLVECGVTQEDFQKYGKADFVKEYFETEERKEDMQSIKGSLDKRIMDASKETENHPNMQAVGIKNVDKEGRQA